MKKLLVICGPTATGKTAVSVVFAKKFAGELVSADSRQVYIGMDIGTGKDKKKLDGIRMWLYDVVRPDKSFSVTQYRAAAISALADIWSRGKLPIVVGGTGYYIDAILSPQKTFGIAPDRALRKKLEHFTVPGLQNELKQIDPDVFGMLNNSDRNNPRRLIRKIEIAKGPPPKTEKEIPESGVDCKMIGLTAPQDELYTRIDGRVDARVSEGIIGEITGLLQKGFAWSLPAMSGSGYKEWKPFFDSAADRETVIARWKTDEHQYAKRQFTWFRRNPRIEWYDVTRPDYQSNMTDSVQAWYTGNGK